MIRAARSEDVPRLVEMGQRFRENTSYSKHLANNPAKMAETAAKLIAVDGILVTERAGKVVGMIGFIFHDHFISGELSGGEVFWWVEPEHRGEGVKLVKAAEAIARAKGATNFQMIAPTGQVMAVYERLGYEFVEATYQKNL